MQIVNAYCDKLLNFEVPLQDIFLKDDVHPAIKNLFEAAYKSISQSGFSIKTVIGGFQGTLTERYLLKDQLLTMGYFSGDEASPGAYLWLLRHFLGLLPLPLLPTDCRGRGRSSWRFLCDCCVKLLDGSCCEICSTFCYSLARYINGLPDVNRMLLLNLLSLFGCLSGKNDRGVACLADYFASAIFVRPYYPGNGIKFCRHGYYFLIFLMVHWDVLRPLCKTPKTFKMQTFENGDVCFGKIRRVTSVTIFKRNLIENNKRYHQSAKAIQTVPQERFDHDEGDVLEKSPPPETKIDEISGEDEYFYDEDFKNLENSFSGNQTVLTGMVESNNVGWTFTPPPTSTPLPIGWNIDKNNHKLNVNDNENCDDGFKTPEKKSVISLQSIQSKLKKIRSSFCGGVKKSNSSEYYAPCKIKYKKMDSSRNNSF